MAALNLVAWTPEGVSAIPLCRRDGSIRAFSWVDTEDFEAASFISWALHPHGYVTRKVGPRAYQYTFRLHRLILGLRDDDPREADHINGNRKDNRRRNLRAVEPRHNKQNLRPRTENVTSLHRGVCWDKTRGKWKAESQVDGRRVALGRFATEEEAHEAAVSYRREHMPYSTH